MNTDNQKMTLDVYNDPEVVTVFVEQTANKLNLLEFAKDFVKMMKGKKLVDIGCGPGQYSYVFQELGCEVTGSDYSQEMIKAAENFKNVENKPAFKVCDMRDLEKSFEENSFDAAWISASLIHIPEDEVPQVLSGLRKILTSKSPVYIGLKGGIQGSQIVTDTKYKKTIQREFIFWQEENFVKLAKEYGLELIKSWQETNGVTGKEPTQWINLLFQLNK